MLKYKDSVFRYGSNILYYIMIHCELAINRAHKQIYNYLWT